VKRPTGLPRDSSLRIVKAPGKMLSCREAQTVAANIGAHAAMRHGNAAVRAMIFAGRSQPASPTRGERDGAILCCQMTSSGTAISSTDRPARCPAEGVPEAIKDNSRASPPQKVKRARKRNRVVFASIAGTHVNQAMPMTRNIPDRKRKWLSRSTGHGRRTWRKTGPMTTPASPTRTGVIARTVTIACRHLFSGHADILPPIIICTVRRETRCRNARVSGAARQACAYLPCSLGSRQKL
jgi:hypothetical protein